MSRIPVKEYVKQIMQASKRDDAEAVELLLEEFGRKRSEESNTALREQIKAAIDCGSFEVRFSDGRKSVYFYWDDIPSRRLRPEQVDQETAKKQAQEFARKARTS
ncbi:hypothetical protein ABIE85_001459 [Bradyrhizobium diazoefficiens]|uniref:hypothetical protein n=1 Tax=Bradyrhizobium diazoefficiens TaxID=1355477 RepID=UPI00272D1160|nr:hypothetical protein [Bradyrhizobium diazoefficiens]WLA60273.1 hypothetical protein QIH81_16890 [Bradyrhizobium diazoefficiens]